MTGSFMAVSKISLLMCEQGYFYGPDTSLFVFEVLNHIADLASQDPENISIVCVLTLSLHLSLVSWTGQI